MEQHQQRAIPQTSWRARRRAINWIAAVGCFGCALAYTVADRPLSTIVTLVVLGVANLAFILLK